MIGCATNRNGDLSTVSSGTASFASRAGFSTRVVQIRLSDLVVSSLSICSTSTSLDSVIANRSPFSAIELQSMIGTITIGSFDRQRFDDRFARHLLCFDVRPTALVNAADIE